MLLTMLNPFAQSGEAITAADAKAMIKNKKAILVDVREAQEVLQTGRAEGALNIPTGQLAARARPGSPECDPALTSELAVIVYCATGARSGMAGKILSKLGYAKVYNMGSLGNWQAAGGRVVQ